MKQVATFREAYQAHILKGVLESEGIPASVQDEQIATINWAYSQAIGGVKVNVPDGFYQKALEIIEKINQQGEADEKSFEDEAGPADVCPECGSKSLAPTKFSRWSLLPSLIFMIPVLFGKKRWQCKDCGHIMKY